MSETVRNKFIQGFESSEEKHYEQAESNRSLIYITVAILLALVVSQTFKSSSSSVSITEMISMIGIIVI